MTGQAGSSPNPRYWRWFQIAGRLLWLELVGGYALVSLYVFIQRLEGANPGADFIIYYGASLLALAGEAAAIFDWPSLRAAQAGVIGAPVHYLPWLYPPPLMLVVTPLATLPYIPAFAVWVTGQLALLAAAVGAMGRRPIALLAAMVFPATINNILVGQNGALSAALLGGGLVVLNRHPVLAGIMFGLLVYKPHLLVVVPFALLAMGAWRTMAAALASALGVSLLSLIAFGAAPWAAFLQAAPSGVRALEYGSDHWAKMPTVFAALRLLGAEVPLAYSGQGVSAVLAISVVIYMWRQGIALPLRASALLFATFLTTPYAFFYDQVVLIFAILWLGSAGSRPGGRIILVLLWLAPVALWLLAQFSQISLWPLLLVCCLAWLYWSTRRAPCTGRQ
ncbi:MAG: DUF2029 domain-containing protein [Alphaproteobacteria bacterium]|nr:DUF2029 domain-containing protein [Alphaproteobacteria bacterium]